MQKSEWISRRKHGRGEIYRKCSMQEIWGKLPGLTNEEPAASCKVSEAAADYAAAKNCL